VEPAAHVRRYDEDGGGNVQPVQDWSRFVEIVAISVIEGDRDAAEVVDGAAKRNNLSAVGEPLHLIGEGSRPNVHLVVARADAVIREDEGAVRARARRAGSQLARSQFQAAFESFAGPHDVVSIPRCPDAIRVARTSPNAYPAAYAEYATKRIMFPLAMA